MLTNKSTCRQSISVQGDSYLALIEIHYFNLVLQSEKFGMDFLNAEVLVVDVVVLCPLGQIHYCSHFSVSDSLIKSINGLLL